MKRLGLVVLALFVMTGFAYAKNFEVSKQAGPYAVTVTLDKNPPVTGDNAVTIAVKEAGKAITDAQVAIDYSMPAMPGMPAMNYKAATALKGGLYTGTVRFSMSGAWNMTVKIGRGGKTQSVKLNIDVR